MTQLRRFAALILQIESADGVANVDAIAATPGVDALWIGHFELWSQDGWPTFRHTLVAGRDLEIGLSMVDDVIETARAECDRFYPAFQFVIWGERSADEAIDAALVEPVGEA